jgi:hypothetical protein
MTDGRMRILVLESQPPEPQLEHLSPSVPMQGVHDKTKPSRPFIGTAVACRRDLEEAKTEVQKLLNNDLLSPYMSLIRRDYTMSCHSRRESEL